MMVSHSKIFEVTAQAIYHSKLRQLGLSVLVDPMNPLEDPWWDLFQIPHLGKDLRVKASREVAAC